MSCVRVFRALCVSVCRKKVVTQNYYLACVDAYYVICTSGCRSDRLVNQRHLRCVYLKYRRTSVYGLRINPHTFPACAVTAFSSHSKTSPHSNGRQVRKSVTGRWGGHYPQRYSKIVVSDLFGYPRHRLASGKTAPPGSGGTHLGGYFSRVSRALGRFF